MTTALPITFANLPTGLNAMSLFDQQFAAAVNGAYFVTDTVPASALTDNGVSAGTYGDGSHVPQVTVTAKGLLGSVSSIAIAIAASQVTSGGSGTGDLVRVTSPTLVTPTLGVAAATSINKVALTAPATGSTITVADGKTLTVDKTLELDGTDGTKMTFPGASSNVLTTGNTATITKGYSLTPYSIGNIGSPFTPDPANGNYQYGTNHGAATWNIPVSDCAIQILVTNDGTAGAITFSGYTVGSNIGSALTTTNTNKFLITITRINGVATYSVYALQ